jgi:EAL and modified HD-GYP domain-containing signal transduction protein
VATAAAAQDQQPPADAPEVTLSAGVSLPGSPPVGRASLARQPIVDRSGQLHGYELLFRGRMPESGFDGDRATAEVLVAAACDLGWQRLGGGHPLFLNVDEGLLMGGLIDLAPPEHTVIEVVEGVRVDAAVRERITALREAGFRIALDDFVPGTSAETLMPLAHVVKIDVLATPAPQWPGLVEWLHEQGLVAVAEKVEDRETHDRALAAGFDLFQGYWYARPADQPSLAMSPRHVVCLRLLSALSQDETNMGRIEELVSSDAVLTVRTLRMANSAAAGAGREISSLTQALVLVGPATLAGWIALMLVASEDPPEVMTSIDVLVRARACQLVSKSRVGGAGGEAFLAGLVSALAEKSGIPVGRMLDTVGASNTIRAAVLEGRGELGAVVRDVDLHISGFDLDAGLDVQMAHLAAVVWGHELLQMG